MIKIRSVFFVIFFFMILFIAGYTYAGDFNQWSTYHGAWFEIQYPGDFIVLPSIKSNGEKKLFDSVFFQSPDGAVEFYVYSPQWGGRPKDIEINKAKEFYVAREEKTNGGVTNRWFTIAAKDASYLRSYINVCNTDLNTRRVFGIKYRDQQIYEKYKDRYIRFKSSLIQ